MVIDYSKVWTNLTTVFADCHGHRRGAVLADDAQVAAVLCAAFAAVPGTVACLPHEYPTVVYLPVGEVKRTDALMISLYVQNGTGG